MTFSFIYPSSSFPSLLSISFFHLLPSFGLICFSHSILFPLALKVINYNFTLDFSRHATGLRNKLISVFTLLANSASNLFTILLPMGYLNSLFLLLHIKCLQIGSFLFQYSLLNEWMNKRNNQPLDKDRQIKKMEHELIIRRAPILLFFCMEEGEEKGGQSVVILNIP